MGSDTGLSRKQRVLLVLAGALFVLVLPLLVNAALSSLYTAEPGITYDSSDGPQIELATELESDAAEPFPEENTVDMSPQAEFYSDGPTQATVDQFGDDGSQTQLSDLNVSDHQLEIDVGDRERVAIQGDADEIAFNDPDVDAGEVMTVTQSGTSEISIWGVDDELVAVIDSDSQEIIEWVEPDDGIVTFDVDGDRSIEMLSGEPPVIDSDSAEPVGDQDEFPESLQVDVESGSGIDEDLDVEFELNGEDVGSDTVTGSGTASTSVDVDDVGTHTWTVTVTNEFGDTSTEEFEFELDDTPPEIDRDSAEPVGDLSTMPDDLSVDIAPGTDFASEFEAEFELNGESVGTDSFDGSGTASVPFDEEDGGSHTWSVTVTDEFGQSSTEEFEFAFPDELIIRDVTTAEVINEANVTVEFFSGELVTEAQTTDGVIDMGGVPVEENLIVSIDAEGYHSRTTIIPSILEQQTAWMLDQDEDSVLNEFEINDETGSFQTGETRLEISRPIPDEDTDERTFEVVAGDYFGADGVFPVELATGQRYQLAVVNDDGERRSVGTYTPRTDGLRTIDIGSTSWSLGDDESYATEARYTTEEIDGEEVDHIIFEFGDPENRVSDLEVRVEDRFNSSNVIHDESVADPSDYRLVLPLEEDQTDTQWVINYSATVDGEVRQAKMPVGPSEDIPLPMDAQWLQTLVIVALVVLAAAFPGPLSSIGGAVVVSMAGLAMMAGWLGIPVSAWFVAATIAALGILRAREAETI
ncbi:hypothetical protein OB905_13200 [Halobacteria archaeon AArc-dxtr1]|nr:hypothetical protein [Halobacteria archaeon AArc-dxtr1]